MNTPSIQDLIKATHLTNDGFGNLIANSGSLFGATHKNTVKEMLKVAEATGTLTTVKTTRQQIHTFTFEGKLFTVKVEITLDAHKQILFQFITL